MHLVPRAGHCPVSLTCLHFLPLLWKLVVEAALLPGAPVVQHYSSREPQGPWPGPPAATSMGAAAVLPVERWTRVKPLVGVHEDRGRRSGGGPAARSYGLLSCCRVCAGAGRARGLQRSARHVRLPTAAGRRSSAPLPRRRLSLFLLFACLACDCIHKQPPTFLRLKALPACHCGDTSSLCAGLAASMPCSACRRTTSSTGCTASTSCLTRWLSGTACTSSTAAPTAS